MSTSACPVCHREDQVQVSAAQRFAGLLVDCRTCGYFDVPRTTITVILDSLEAWVRPLLSHWLRRAEEPSTPRTVIHLTDEIVRIVTRRGAFPALREQGDNAIQWIGDEVRVSNPAGNLKLTDHAMAAAVIGASNPQSLYFLLDDLVQRKILRGVAEPTLIELGLTIEGWDRYDALKHRDTRSNLAFMAMPFDVPLLDKVFAECFVPAVASTGFELRRVIDKQGAGLIDDQIRVAIRRSRFLLCELTGGNRGAYWEAGFAEGIGIPVIYACEVSQFSRKNTRPHFDTNHHVAIIWTKSDLADATVRLKATIRATLPLEAKMGD